VATQQDKTEQQEKTAPAAQDKPAAAAGYRKVAVRLSHRPGEDTQVWPHELDGLHHQGLLSAEDLAAAKAATSGATARQ
jgi:hypothetical protein